MAFIFEETANQEKEHAKRVFKRDGKVVWRCRNCGCLHESGEAPDACPACANPRDYYELLGENW